MLQYYYIIIVIAVIRYEQYVREGLAVKTITGCFRTTSTNALQHEIQLLPVELELRKYFMKYLTRIQTLPENHPTKIWLQESKRYHK